MIGKITNVKKTHKKNLPKSSVFEALRMVCNAKVVINRNKNLNMKLSAHTC